MAGEEGAVHGLILYNAALRLWVTDDTAPLEDHLQRAREALLSGGAWRLLERLRRPVAALW